MVFYAAKVMRDARMANPTLVFITDRNDLDNQLYEEVFAPAHILPESPVQAETRKDLRTRLTRASGGIVFTTIQKFAPGEDGDASVVLTDRRNVIVIADEAHRSQYGFSEYLDRSGRLKAGLAKHMRDALPGATYLGFTGTPIDSADKSTRSVFGDYVDVYDLTRAVEDGATVRIFTNPDSPRLIYQLRTTPRSTSLSKRSLSRSKRTQRPLRSRDGRGSKRSSVLTLGSTWSLQTSSSTGRSGASPSSVRA